MAQRELSTPTTIGQLVIGNTYTDNTALAHLHPSGVYTHVCTLAKNEVAQPIGSRGLEPTT